MNELKKNIETVKGFSSSGIACGIKESGHKDLALICSETPSVAAGVFTKNSVKSASVLWNRRIIVGRGEGSAILVNSGNANACTGKQGAMDVEEMANITANLLGTSPNRVLICSTGIIGVPLPMTKIRAGIQTAFNALSKKSGKNAAEAIMTTDTFPKYGSIEFKLRGKKIHIGGIAKGSGMINPNMATMLAFIITDLDISPILLRQALKRAADISFNSITVDGDTSTNDTVLLLANGAAGNSKIDNEGKEFQTFFNGLKALCMKLAEQIVHDGEGASKFVRIRVKGGKSSGDAKKVAAKIANSNLVKTAMFGEDANWGRIICSAGNAGVRIDFDKMDLSAGNVCIIKKGKPIGTTLESSIKNYLKKKEIVLTLHLHLGNCEAEVLTTDLTYDYIRINSSYRT